jgi:hypothetical protein
MALARMLMGGPAETQGTAFEPVTRQQQILNYNTMTGAEDAWRSAEGSPWKAPPPGMLAKILMHPVTQGVMPALDFMGRTPTRSWVKGYHGSPQKFDRFDFDRIGKGETNLDGTGTLYEGHGVYATTNKGEAAREYAGQSYGNQGHVYGVKVNAAPENTLDLSAPLMGQDARASERIRPLVEQFIAAGGKSRYPAQKPDGADLLAFLEKSHGGKGAADVLKAHGITVNKAYGGDYMVALDPAAVKITSRDGLWPSLANMLGR